MSFNDLTAELGTTRANIHYHFGLKSHLAEEVLEEQVGFVLSTYRSWWLDDELSLKHKMLASSEFNEQRYKVHNPNDEGRIWSLITRFRFDEDVITPKMKAKLAEFSLGVESAVRVGVNRAVETGELCANAPVDEIVCLIADVIHSSSLISHAPYGIGHLVLSYKALSDLIFRAYGRREMSSELTSPKPVAV
jgi:AcrR family transcriptional regulator